MFISGRACRRRLTGAEVLALMDNSDIDLSDSEMDFGDSTDSSGAADTDVESEEEAITPAPKRRVMWKKTDVFNPIVVPELVQQDLSTEHQQWSPLEYFVQYVDDSDYQEHLNSLCREELMCQW